jgi:DNA-binding NarL/FixJ family response regulator
MSLRAPETSAPLILCIEDEEALRRDLVEELQDAGYRVIEAEDGDDALIQLESVRPDLILCDICMPGMDGYELLDILQDRAGDYAEIPFLFLTALADRHDVLEGKRLGADDYLVKPVDYDLLLATVHARLRQITRIREQARLVRGAGPDRDTTLTDIDAATRDPNIAAILDRISTAIVLIDGDRRIGFINQAAQSVVDSCPELRLALDGTRRAAGLSAWLDELFEQLAEGDVSAFALPRGDDESQLMMVGCKLVAEGTHSQLVALFITGFADAPDLPSHVLASLFGFTPTEGLIAVALARGDKPAEIATGLGIAQTTVAFHMRNIFQKAGVSRQAGLVALLHTCPASLL